MTSILWDSEFLQDFAEELQKDPTIQFWETDVNGDVMDFKSNHFKKMLNKFFPAMGVRNLQLGTNDKGRPTSTLVFIRGNRCDEIDPPTLKQITLKLFNEYGVIGTQIRNNFYKENVFNKDELGIIPDLDGKKMYRDTALSAKRFFQNGFVEITSNGVSKLKSYDEIPEDMLIWNSCVIPKDYEDTPTKEVLEQQLQSIQVNSIHPETGETIYSSNDRVKLFQEWKDKIENFKGDNPPTHFKDFVRNLSLDEFGEVDENSLNRLEYAIGYLCHIYNPQSQRKYVLLVDRFYDGYSRDTANGGNGKSLLVNTLGTLMNLTIVNGKEIKKDASSFKLAQVNNATEIVHLDDAHSNFDADRMNPLVTGNFHIERKHKDPFSIPAQDAPKIAVTTNHPILGKGHTFKRRQFICEVSHYYRHQDEDYGISLKQLHGFKDFPLPTQIHTEGTDFGWEKEDWNEFYRYVFECIQKYLKNGGLPSGGESEYYMRAKLVEEIGSDEITTYLIEKLNSLELGVEYFCDEIYKELYETFPLEMEDVSTMKMYGWMVEIGKLTKIVVNHKLHGKQDQQRLNEERWERWVSVGLEDWKNKEGRVRNNPKEVPSQQQDRVSVFKLSSLKDLTSMVSKPDFSSKNNEDKVTTEPANKVRRRPKKKMVNNEPQPSSLETFFE